VIRHGDPHVPQKLCALRFNGGKLRHHALALRAGQVECDLVEVAAEAACLARDVLQEAGQSSDVIAHGSR